MEIQDIKLYNLQELKEILNVSERTLLTYLKRGKLKGQKINKRWQISERNLKAFIHGDTHPDIGTE
jgi:predicted site-specific integrase-resolvase